VFPRLSGERFVGKRQRCDSTSRDCNTILQLGQQRVGRVVSPASRVRTEQPCNTQLRYAIRGKKKLRLNAGALMFR
jgi:hypothetical protein